MQRTVRASYTAVVMISASLSLFMFTGCGDDGPPRIAVHGKVTWKGQPVPRGVIYFGPDVHKGNSGPKGYALIEDGVFDTRRPPGKGCVAGPHRVQIQGFDGQNIRDGYPYGDPIFASYDTGLDVSSDIGEIELVVPDTVKAIAPGAIEQE